MISEKKIFLSFSHYKSLGANEPSGSGQGLDWQDYVGDHQTLLHIKYISSGPHGFREEDFFKFFPIISLWELMTPGA